MSIGKKTNRKENPSINTVKKVLQKAEEKVVTLEKRNHPFTTFEKVLQKREEISVTLRKENTQVRYLRLKRFHVPNSGAILKIVPELRIYGKWFQEAGFNALDYVSVTVMDGLLIIRNVQEISE